MAENTPGTEPTGAIDPPAHPYTLHDDAAVTADETTGRTGTAPTGPRGPDPVGLVAGLAALAVAILAITDSLAGLDPRWFLACAAIVVGAVVLSAVLGRRARHDR